MLRLRQCDAADRDPSRRIRVSLSMCGLRVAAAHAANVCGASAFFRAAGGYAFTASHGFVLRAADGSLTRLSSLLRHFAISLRGTRCSRSRCCVAFA
jgi:hypothetical protein